MNTAITLRAAAIETARKITGKPGNKESAREHFNRAIAAIKNPAFLSPEEFYRRIYNYLINTLNTPNKMKFYQIENPTTQQIFDAIINNEYTPLEKIKPKAKQIEILLKNHFCTDEILITFSAVTNAGGIPIFLSEGTSIYEVAEEQNEDWHELSEEEQNNEIELLSSYLRTYKDIFNH